MFNDPNQLFSVKQQQQQQRYYSNPLVNRQISMSSMSSSLFLLNYQSSKSSYLQTKNLPSIVNV